MTKACLCLLVPALAVASPDAGVAASVGSAVADAMKAADRYRDVLEIKISDPASASDDLGAHGMATARACSAAVDQALAAGATDKTEILVDGYKKVVLGTIKPDHCEALASLAVDFDAKVQAAKQKRDDNIAAPFKTAGLGGDKLAFAIRWAKQDFDFYGVGGVILKPAGMKSATVLFLLTGDREHDWQLHRYLFKGDKLVSSSEQTFLVRPAPSKFR